MNYGLRGSVVEPDQGDIFRYTNEIRHAYQQHFAQIQLNISEAGISGVMI
jgi:hypothetical protein